MNTNKATYLGLGAGRYDCCGNLFFEVKGVILGFGIAAQIEFIITLQDSLLDLSEYENAAFNTIIDMLYAQKNTMKPVAS